MAMGRIGVIVPAYNEASVIGKVLRGLPAKVQVNRTSYHLVPVVVDDGSHDNTAAVAQKHPRAIVISHLINSGAGAATRTGLRYLRENNFQYGATMDADGQHTIKDVLKAVEAVIAGNSNLVIGSRLVNSSGMPRIKVVGNKGLSIFTGLLLSTYSTDTQSGLRAFDRKAIETLTYRENGYAFCSEMIWRARTLGLTMSEVPITAVYTEYSKNKGQNNWNAFHIIKQLVKHRVRNFLYE